LGENTRWKWKGYGETTNGRDPISYN